MAALTDGEGVAIEKPFVDPGDLRIGLLIEEGEDLGAAALNEGLLLEFLGLRHSFQLAQRD